MNTIVDVVTPKADLSPVGVSAHEGGLEMVVKFVDEWRELCPEALDDQPFFRPEWVLAYLRAFAPDARLLLLIARKGQRPRLVLPLIAERSVFSGVPVRKLRSPVNAHSCRFDAVRTAGPEGDAAIYACWEHLKKSDNWDLLEFDNLTEASSVDRLAAVARADGFRAAEVPHRPSPCVEVPTDPKRLLQLPRNARLRTKLRQARRELTRRGGLRFYRVETADRDSIERFYQLEAAGWKGREGSAINCSPRTRKFYDQIAESAARFGYFSLYMLEWRGHLLAAHFAVCYQGQCYSPKVTYNENFKEFAPGHLIVSEILQDCAAHGIQRYDITGPDDDWKMKWTADARPVHDLLVFGQGITAQLAFASRFRLRRAIGRLLPKRQQKLNAHPGSDPEEAA